jgi:hypothetical protein
MFTFSTAGRKNCWFKIEKQTLQEHIQIYIDIMNLLLENWYHLNNITFLISDIRILEKLMKEYDINRSKLTTKTTDLNYSFFWDLWYNINWKVNWEDLNNLNIPILNDLMLWLKQLNEKLICDFIEKNPNISFKYDLWRLAWMWYYDSYCFKVLAKNQDNLTLPLVDAWFSNWTRKLLRNEKEFYFSSWFWLELFLENFKK